MAPGPQGLNEWLFIIIFFYWISFFNSIQSFLRLNGFCFKPNELKPNRKWMEINWQLLWSIACFYFCVVFCLMVFLRIAIANHGGTHPKRRHRLAGRLTELTAQLSKYWTSNQMNVFVAPLSASTPKRWVHICPRNNNKNNYNNTFFLINKIEFIVGPELLGMAAVGFIVPCGGRHMFYTVYCSLSLLV